MSKFPMPKMAGKARLSNMPQTPMGAKVAPLQPKRAMPAMPQVPNPQTAPLMHARMAFGKSKAGCP
jgi:hypothetical protein